MLPNKKTRTSMLNAEPQQKQPTRSCPHRATELNAGKVKRDVTPTSACPDKSTETNILSLPKEVMFDILVLLPADVLYNTMRYMSFQWYKIIHDPVFIKVHLLRTNPGLFTQWSLSPLNCFYADTSMIKDVTSTRIDCQISGQVWASCNGLVLFSDPKDKKTLHIVNPITKQRVTLPQFKREIFALSFTLACARSTGEYKVVITYASSEPFAFLCEVMTVGKDLTWRTFDTQHISLEPGALTFRPRSAGGYIYWANHSGSHFLTLDVEAEVLREFPVPKAFTQGWNIVYTEIGNSLGCMFWFYATLVFEVLVLADPKSGKWENLYKFDLHWKRDILSSWLFKNVFPPPTHLPLRLVAWVNNGEVVVFTTHRPPNTTYPYIVHNVETGETYSFDNMCTERGFPFWCGHVNTLVWFEQL